MNVLKFFFPEWLPIANFCGLRPFPPDCLRHALTIISFSAESMHNGTLSRTLKLFCDSSGHNFGWKTMEIISDQCKQTDCISQLTSILHLVPWNSEYFFPLWSMTAIKICHFFPDGYLICLSFPSVTAIKNIRRFFLTPFSYFNP